jgi:5-methylcytosine-specific restriction protein A
MPTKPEPKKYKINHIQRKSWSSTDFEYNSQKWIKLRNAVRIEEPICKECLKKDLIRPTKVIDHINPISKGGDPYDRENLQGLCESCHNRKTAKENN